jgi:hypothetical protein
MAVSLVRLEQIRKTDDPDDTLTGTQVEGVESSAVDHLDFLKGVLSQFKRIIHGDDSGNWFDDIADVFTTPASLKALHARATLEGKNVLANRANLTDITVTTSQNWMELTGSNKPDKNIAIAGSALGAVTAQLVGAIGSHSLTEVSGSNTLRPKNLVNVFDGATGDAILSSGRRVYGLLQVGSAATDGNPFGNTSSDDQGQLSFVRANATYDDLEACPVADIEGKAIVYTFSWRESVADLPEEFFRGDLESADPQAGVTVSLDSAYDGGYLMTVDGTDVDIRLADTKSWVFRAGTGSALVTITRNDSTGDEVQLDVDILDVNNATDANFLNGALFDTGGTTINVGVTAGQIDATALELEATTGDLSLVAADDISFKTVRESTALPLDDATAGKISTLFSQSFASISAAIKYAGEHGGVDMSLKVTTLGSNYAQGDNIPGAVQNVTTYPIDMNTPGGVKQLVFLNGRLLLGGNGSTKNDVYVGTTAADGDIKVDFVKGVKTGDVIISVVLAE